MGVGFNFICFDCKKTCYLGYGSYKTWLGIWRGEIQTVKEFETSNSEYKTYKKNQNYYKCLLEHENHNFAVHDMSQIYQKNDGLWEDHYPFAEDILLYPDVKLYTFEEINLDE